MFVSDLRHFLDLPPDVPGPARRMADHLSRLVRAATAADAGFVRVSALPCSRRPGRRPCPGHMLLLRTDVPPSIEWKCTSCGDDGVISGWERSPFDLRPRADEDQADSGIDALEVVIDPEVAATLRTLLLLDTAAERLVYRAEATEQVVVLAGDEDAFEELIESVAAEANHEQDRRQQKRLDAAFQALTDALSQPPRR